MYNFIQKSNIKVNLEQGGYVVYKDEYSTAATV